MAFRNLLAFKTSDWHSILPAKSVSLASSDAPESFPSYDAPGKVKDLNTRELKRLWNELIQRTYSAEDFQKYHSRFFTLDYNSIQNGNDFNTVRWSGDPAEPNFCFNEKKGQQLSDWVVEAGHPIHSSLSVKGRRETHNEYCEYRIIFGIDSNTKLRPKRVVFTTELREYWMLLAQHSPEQLRAACLDNMGRVPNWSELYGPNVHDPNLLSPNERLLLFATWVAGAADEKVLLDAGVPTHPIGVLNNTNALFMTHRINGLDDLLYIVLYGAHPYARKENNTWVRATKDEIFSKSHFEEETPPIQLACRHADPAAALGAAAQAFEGRQVGFANPLGMYILSFAKEDFLFQGNPIPDSWVRFKRGAGDGLYQRLELGPSDEESGVFLDDITVGDEEVKLEGGFQLAQRLEVGPWLRIGDKSNVSDEEYERFKVEKLDVAYNCAEARVCTRLSRLFDEYNELTK